MLSTEGVTGSIPSPGTKILHATWCGKKKRERKGLQIQIHCIIPTPEEREDGVEWNWSDVIVQAAVSTTLSMLFLAKHWI